MAKDSTCSYLLLIISSALHGRNAQKKICSFWDQRQVSQMFCRIAENVADCHKNIHGKVLCKFVERNFSNRIFHHFFVTTLDICFSLKSFSRISRWLWNWWFAIFRLLNCEQLKWNLDMNSCKLLLSFFWYCFSLFW